MLFVACGVSIVNNWVEQQSIGHITLALASTTDLCYAWATLRTLVNHVNSLAERQDQLFSIRRGKPVRNRVRGRGKYKSFTAKTMLKSAFLCFGMAQLSCKVNLQLHKDREVASLAVCSKVRHIATNLSYPQQECASQAPNPSTLPSSRAAHKHAAKASPWVLCPFYNKLTTCFRKRFVQTILSLSSTAVLYAEAMFSLSSTAYWLSCSTQYLRSVTLLDIRISSWLHLLSGMCCERVQGTMR